MTAWFWLLGLSLVAVAVLLRIRRQEPSCSSEWIADQTRRRGLRGYEGAYEER